MLQEIPGDDQALRSRAAQLSRSASSLQTAIDQLQAVGRQATSSGTNTVMTSLETALQRKEASLGIARDVMQQASQHLNQLANELEQIDAEAIQQGRRMEATYGHPMAPLTYVEPYVARADNARAQTAAQLVALTHRAPGNGQTAHHGFLRDVWDGTLGDLLSGVDHLATGLWNLTGREIYDRKGADQSWDSVIHGVEYIFTHKKQFAESVPSSLADMQLFHKDFSAWVVATAINVGSLFVGVGEFKAAMRLLDLRVALKAGESVGDTAKLLAQYPAVAARAKILSLPGSTGLWNLGHFQRGFAAEDLVASIWSQKDPGSIHLYSTHPSVDLWNPDLGQVTSVKSIDPAAPTYVNSPSAFYGKLNGYVQKLQDYTPTKLNNGAVTLRDYRLKQLVIVLPETGLTDAQALKINDLLTNPENSDIDIQIVEVPR